MSKKKIKVKVKKRRLKIKRILICILSIIFIGLLGYYFSKLPIRNIYVIGNRTLSDKEIIEYAGISDYPSFLNTHSTSISDGIKNHMYIKSVNVKKRLYNKVYIYIEEKKILCIYDNKLILEDGSMVDNNYNITSYPILMSDISGVKDKFIDRFSLVNNDILLKISEVEYTPNEVDNERFMLRMNDGNLVYVTLNKIEKVNRYNSIYSSLDGKKGIIYLDSGDYVEVRE